MLFVTHDFYGNFTGSVSSGDSELTISIFNSELSDLLAYKLDQLLEVFNKLKIDYSKSASYSTLVDTVYESMGSEKFLRGLAFLIGENNKIQEEHKGRNYNGMLDNIVAGLSNIASQFKINESVKREAKLDTLQMVKLKTSLAGGTTRRIENKDNTVLWILLIAGVGVGLYYLYKHYKNKPAVASTGNALPPVANTVPEPPKVAPPVNPYANDPAMNVSPDVLIPVSSTPQLGSGGTTASPASTTVTITNGAPAVAQPAPTVAPQVKV